MQRSSLFVLSIAVSVMLGSQAIADINGADFELFTLGEVNGQDGWTSGHGSSSTPLYDVEVVSNIYGHAGFGNKSLRISNALTSGSYNDQTFSKSLSDEAGEMSAPTGTYSGGIRQPYFEASWDFASTVPESEQPGLSVVASPDRGDTMRMSWVQMQDTPAGLQLNFEDYQHAISNFVLTAIATGLDRTVPHTIRITINFIDGATNDVVTVYLDGVLIHTGTTWEDYYRDWTGSGPYPVDSIMFRVAGTAFPSNSGKGYVIDNFSSYSGPIPIIQTVTNRIINIQQLPDGGVRITASGTPTLWYIGQAAQDISAPVWFSFSTNTPGTNNLFTMDDPDAINYSRRSYRTIAQ